MKLCKKCANEVKDNASICPNCGSLFTDNKEIIIDENPTNKKEDLNDAIMNSGLFRGPFNKYISIVLCIFLGWLGIHKFYEKKYYMGVFYVFTIGFWGIGIILDLIKLIRKPKKYYVSVIPFIG